MIDIKSESIRMVDIETIVPHPKNSNRHSIEQIARLEHLIAYQGFRNPLVISNYSGFLVAGHGRLTAAENLGITELPVIFQDFDDEAQEFSYLISDNEIARWAELDKHMVYTELKDMKIVDFDVLGIDGFNMNAAIPSYESGETNIADEWEGMPEFDQKDETSFRHVIVHFENKEDAYQFFNCIDQKDTGKTKSLWYPPQDRMDTESRRYE